GYPLRQARLLRRFRFGYRQGQRWLLLGALAIQRYFQPELPAITGRFEAITHLKALGQADEQHLYLIAVRFHSPGQTLPLGLYPATARLAVQLDAAQLQTDGTALIGALITDGTIEQQLQDEPRAIVLRQYFQQARGSACRNDRSDGLRLDLDRLGGPRGQQRQSDARQHQRSDHQQPTPQPCEARPACGCGFVGGVQAGEPFALGRRGTARFEIAEHVVDQAHGSTFGNCSSQGQAPIRPARDSAQPNSAQLNRCAEPGRAPSVSASARHT